MKKSTTIEAFRGVYFFRNTQKKNFPTNIVLVVILVSEPKSLYSATVCSLVRPCQFLTVLQVNQYLPNKVWCFFFYQGCRISRCSLWQGKAWITITVTFTGNIDAIAICFFNLSTSLKSLHPQIIVQKIKGQTSTQKNKVSWEDFNLPPIWNILLM